VAVGVGVSGVAVGRRGDTSGSVSVITGIGAGVNVGGSVSTGRGSGGGGGTASREGGGGDVAIGGSMVGTIGVGIPGSGSSVSTGASPELSVVVGSKVSSGEAAGVPTSDAGVGVLVGMAIKSGVGW